MANQTLVEDYVRLSMVNREYGRLRPRFQFLLDSFVGGDDYRRAGYLVKYTLETDGDYQARLRNTPLDNQCNSIISTYISFLFRNDIDRSFGSWEGSPDLESFLKDADYEGRTFNAFMKEVSTWASVFGHVWVGLLKSNAGATTLGQEIDLGVRPYATLITPMVVNDWTWHRNLNGSYELVYIRYIEEVLDKITIVKEWSPTEIKTWVLDDQKQEAQVQKIEANGLGKVPFICVYNRKSIVRAQGISDINDIADVQRMIYNLTSEREQAHRMDGHPTLVVPPTAQIGSGAGGMIVLQEGTDPALNPYYLQHNFGGIDSISKTISELVDTIDKLANTGAVRGIRAQTVASGVALETEFQLLNARLSEKADCLELAEEQIWHLFAEYQGKTWDGYVKYPDSFSIRDVQREYNELVTAKNAASSPEALAVIDYRVRELLDDPALPPEPATHLTAQGFNAEGPEKTGPVDTGSARRPRRYFATTTTGIE